MEHKDKTIRERRSIITGLGVAAAGIGATAAMSARAQQRETFMPARHSLDAWLGELPGRHRVFIDSATADGGAEALLYANNLYTAQQNAYSGGNSDFAMVVCFRHFSTPFGYNDAMWAKYGEQFAGLMQLPAAADGKTPSVNPMNATDMPELPNFGVTIDTVAAKGTRFAICNAATQFVAGQLANANGGSAEEIHDELVANAIASSRFVAAGVIALTRSQEYGYSLLYAG